MRITAQARELTRRTILEKSHQLFCVAGFEVATIRDIAKAVGVAPGTLFNYYPSKEAIAAALVMKQVSKEAVCVEDYDTLEEVIFAHAALSIRRWKACRTYIQPVLEPTLSVFDSSDTEEPSTRIREQHLAEVQRLAQEFSPKHPMSPLELHLYWTLFLGVVALWSRDRSRKQEATLALLDDSVSMFVGWIGSGPARSQSSREARSRR